MSADGGFGGGSAVADFLAFLEEQSRQYRRELPARLERVASIWRAVSDGSAEAGALLELERHAHGVARTGAMFGLSELGTAARTLECLVHAVRGGHEITTEQHRAISAAVNALRAYA